MAAMGNLGNQAPSSSAKQAALHKSTQVAPATAPSRTPARNPAAQAAPPRRSTLRAQRSAVWRTCGSAAPGVMRRCSGFSSRCASSGVPGG